MLCKRHTITLISVSSHDSFPLIVAVECSLRGLNVKNLFVLYHFEPTPRLSLLRDQSYGAVRATFQDDKAFR